MKILFLILTLFSEGIIVGCGITALLTLLDVIPRLCQISRTYSRLNLYEYIMVGAVVFGSAFSLTDLSFNLSFNIVPIVGMAYGIFIGLLAAALAEAVDVIPIMERRLNIKGYVKYVIFSMIFAKIFGSIIHWTIVKSYIK